MALASRNIDPVSSCWWERLSRVEIDAIRVELIRHEEQSPHTFDPCVREHYMEDFRSHARNFSNALRSLVYSPPNNIPNPNAFSLTESLWDEFSTKFFQVYQRLHNYSPPQSPSTSPYDYIAKNGSDVSALPSPSICTSADEDFDDLRCTSSTSLLRSTQGHSHAPTITTSDPDEDGNEVRSSCGDIDELSSLSSRPSLILRTNEAPEGSFEHLNSGQNPDSLVDDESRLLDGFDVITPSSEFDDDQDKRDWLLIEKPTLWSDIEVSMFDSEMRAMIRKIISQPDTRPWKDVAMVNPDLHQVIMDFLQDELDQSETTGLVRAAATKSVRAISRVSDILPKSLVLQNVERDTDKVTTGGASADIYIGRYDSRKVCLKVLRIFSEPSERTAKVPRWFRHEALLWRQLQHSRILPLYGIVTTMDRPCLVSPWMENGNVIKFLKTHPDSDLLKMLIEISDGIKYLHTYIPPIVHGDIRGGNILVRDDFTCCLADFGVTMVIETREPTDTRLSKGTVAWMSPETFMHSKVNIPSRDIYAFACTVIEIYSKKSPFHDLKDAVRVINEVGVNKKKPPRPKDLHDAKLWAIIDSCLAYEPELRPTATAVLEELKAYASHIRGPDWPVIRGL